MRTVASPLRMQALSLGFRRRGLRIGFVPTMGYLHAGHLDLVRRARAASDVVVVSIFVNRTQFGPGEDYEAYPRDLPRDLRLLREAGANIAFCPPPAAMYAPDASVHVEETALSRGLCGRSRPGHFRGVATVVVKLFNIVQPDIAVFGQKDAQQVLVVRRVVRDLNIPVRLVVAPTVRERDGLAMSSRNAYLGEEERREALCLSRALAEARRSVRGGVRSAAALKRRVLKVIARAPHAAVDYVEIVDAHTLEPVRRIRGAALLALAVRMGRTRLIDNVFLRLPPAPDRHAAGVHQRDRDGRQ